MLDPSLRCILGLVSVLACASPAAAQQASDPLTRFLDSIFKPGAAPSAPLGEREVQPAQPAQPTPAPVAEQPPEPRQRPKAGAEGDARQKAAAPKPQPRPQLQARPEAVPETRAASKPEAEPQPQARPSEREETVEKPPVAPEPQKTASEPPARAAEPPKTTEAAPAAQTVPAPAPVTVAAKASAIPSSPAEALERVNAYFNGIDQLAAYFVQISANGQRAEGTLTIKRPGQLHFAYAPPSTLEIVSDGRSVAIRDKKLGTNDVYPIGQTPLKFLLQENIDLARDTKLRDVQVGRDGIVTVRFDDSATLGGTSKITLRFDARANALKQWTIVDAQGYETTVILSDLNVVRRAGARAAN